MKTKRIIITLIAIFAVCIGVFFAIADVSFADVAAVSWLCLEETGDKIVRTVENSKYDENLIIGKGYSEIKEKYGEFDIVNKGTDDGLMFYDAQCGYLTKKEAKDAIFNDVIPEEYLMIYFNADGIAYKVERNYIDKWKYM